MLSNRKTSVIFLLVVIVLALGFSVFIGRKIRTEGFKEGLTLTEDEVTLLEMTKQYQINDLSLCVSALFQMQPLVTNKNDTNQNFINQTISTYLSSPPVALYNIINHPSTMTPTPPKDYVIPDNVEVIITDTQSKRNQLCSSFIKNIFASVPDLTTKQGNVQPADTMLSKQLQSFQNNTTNGNAPLPGSPVGGVLSAPSDIVVYLSGHFYQT